MMGGKYYESIIKKMIEQDPTDIVVRRVEKVDLGYGNFDEDIVEKTYRGRFYNKRTLTQSIEDGGVIITGREIDDKLLLPITDIQEGDTFERDGRTYRVAMVTTYFDICQQCTLKAVKNETL